MSLDERYQPHTGHKYRISYKCSAKQRLLAEEWERSDGPCGHHFGIGFFSGALETLEFFFFLKFATYSVKTSLKELVAGAWEQRKLRCCNPGFARARIRRKPANFGNAMPVEFRIIDMGVS